MIVHTVQSREAWEFLDHYGYLRGDPTKIMDKSFEPAYVWMIKQMEARLPNRPATNSYHFPVWVWPNYKRSDCEGKKGDVLITLCVPDKMVLLSDFQLWHFPLNGWYLDKDLTGEEYGIAHTDWEIQKSWERIFETKSVLDIQGTMWEVRKTCVLSVKEICK